jgi:hypothetical protein
VTVMVLETVAPLVGEAITTVGGLLSVPPLDEEPLDEEPLDCDEAVDVPAEQPWNIGSIGNKAQTRIAPFIRAFVSFLTFALMVFFDRKKGKIDSLFSTYEPNIRNRHCKRLYGQTDSGRKAKIIQALVCNSPAVTPQS